MHSRAETDNWPMDLYYLFCILNDRNSWVLAGHVATQLGIIFSVWLSDRCTLWPYSERLHVRENDLYNFLDNPIKLKAVLWISFVSLSLTERMVRTVATTLDSAINISVLRTVEISCKPESLYDLMKCSLPPHARKLTLRS